MEEYYEGERITDLKLRSNTLCNTQFIDCHFENCEFENLRLVGCKFVDCVFSDCAVINPVLDICTMSGNDFISCRLMGIHWDGASSGLIAPIDHLEDCELKYNHFVGSRYQRFNFSGNRILESFFANCTLSHSNFRGCALNQTEFYSCDLTGANFENAEGYQIDISNCKLKSAVFSYPEVVNLLNGLKIIIK